MDEFKLLGKLVKISECPVLLDYQVGDDWEDYWQVMAGTWKMENGWLIGEEPENKGGILFSRERFEGDIIFTFKAKTVLPSTRDVNAVFCAEWDTETDYLKSAYVIGLNGWYEGKSGIERHPEDELKALTSLYKYTPGSEVEIVTGVIDGHTFLYVDGEMVTEFIDTAPLRDGYVGFSPYSTRLAIRDIKVRRAVFTPLCQTYEMEK